MHSDTPLFQFLSELHDEVTARLDPDDAESAGASELAFTELIAEELSEYGAVDGIVPCVLDEKTGKGRVRTSGYYLDSESARLDLFVAFYRHAGEGDTITQTDIRNGFDRARRLVQLIDDGQELECSEPSDQAAMVSAIREASAKLKEIRVFILTDCAARDTNEISEPFGDRHSRCLIWDATRLLRVRNSGKDYEPVDINVRDLCSDGLPCLAMPDRECGYRTYLTLIPGDVLYRLYDEYGARLFQLNVRSFLQVRGKVNKGIRNTLINNPSRFLAYNNGITATVESLECERNAQGELILTRLLGFQVVNGGQTVATIHHAAKVDKAPLDGVLIQAKVSAVDEALMEELVPDISRYSNTQNRINEADFSSNDRFHIRIEELSERLWVPGEQSRWFYERARGQYQVAKARASTTPAKGKKFAQEVPTSQRFSKTDLAKCVNSWLQHPDVVSRGAQKNFTAFMDALAQCKEVPEQNEEWYQQLIAQVILFKTAEGVARDLELSPYRANIITYTVALLAYRTQQRIDLGRIWETQCVSPAVPKSLAKWMPLVAQELVVSAKGRNVTEWCKKADCWRHIQMMEIPLPTELEKELSEGQPLPNVGSDANLTDLKLTPEDRENIATVMLIPDTVWLDIHKWGIRDGNLAEFECGIAHTLVKYAAGGWAMVPSRKQARYSVEILKKARGHVAGLDL